LRRMQAWRLAAYLCKHCERAAKRCQLRDCLLASREVARLAIGGLDLPAALGRRGLDGLLGWEGGPEEELRCV
jgi:hypothetical protein